MESQDLLAVLSKQQTIDQQNIEPLICRYKSLKNRIFQDHSVYQQYQQLKHKDRLHIQYGIVSTIDPSKLGNHQFTGLLKFYFQFLNNYMVMSKQNKQMDQFKSDLDQFIDNGMIDQLLRLLDRIDEHSLYLKFGLIFINSLLINVDEYQCLNRNVVSVNNLILKPVEEYLKMATELEPDDDMYFEWVFMIIRNILQKDNGNLGYLVKYGTRQFGTKVLQLLFNGFNRLIDQRMQSSMIYGLCPTIQEIREQYSQCQDSGGRITICQTDLEWLIDYYKSKVNAFIDLYRQNDQFNQINITLNQLFYDFHLMLKIFCQISFIGGYNQQVQKVFTDRTIQHTNLELLIHLKKNSRNYSEQQEGNFYEQIIEEQNHEGILCSILRLMSNMCHINTTLHNQTVQEDSLKHWIGLSQPNQHNPMIREWTIVLIRYLSESDSVQQQLQKLKVIDFEEKSKQFLAKYVQQQDQQDDQIQSIIQGLQKRQAKIDQSINDD